MVLLQEEEKDELAEVDVEDGGAVEEGGGRRGGGEGRRAEEGVSVHEEEVEEAARVGRRDVEVGGGKGRPDDRRQRGDCRVGEVDRGRGGRGRRLRAPLLALSLDDVNRQLVRERENVEGGGEIQQVEGEGAEQEGVRPHGDAAGGRQVAHGERREEERRGKEERKERE